MKPGSKFALAWAGWLLGLAIALLISVFIPSNNWFVGVALGSLLPLGFFLAVLGWIEDK